MTPPLGVRTRWQLAIATATLASVTGLTSFAAPRAASQAAAGDDPPVRLVVLLMVDQMRADYVDRFKDNWTSGLHRLVTEGAWFAKAAYPYLTTVTCPGHATVSTGAFPHRHGIFQNTWYEPGPGKTVACTDDETVRPVSYGGTSNSANSGSRLLIPSFADEMRAQRKSKVVTLALKARSAIMLAGHGGDAVTWLTDWSGGWQTSTAFASAPVPEVKAFLDANPYERDFGKVWTRMLADDRYEFPDTAPGEAPPKGWTQTFPHVLSGNDDAKPNQSFQTQWERSPMADEYIGAMAAALTASMKLGQGETTDVLGVSFSTPDLVGHAFGPRSQEVQDLYARLDRTIGTLFDRLDALVGKGRYLVGLSSDHGVGLLPEQLAAAREEGGRVVSARLGEVIDRVAQAAVGPGRYVARVSGNDIYLLPGIAAKLSAAPAAAAAIVAALEREPGVARAFRGTSLPSQERTGDALTRAAALSFVPRLSGDFIVALKPGWIFATDGTTHGSPNPYDQRVPVMLMGPRVVPGVYDEAATPADLAPTLAALAGITMPRSEGRVLKSAIGERARSAARSRPQ